MVEHSKKTHTDINLFESIDMQVIRACVDEQKSLKRLNMSTTKKSRVEVPKKIFIYDDILGDT